ncbi:MAG: hypothetical protein H0A75_00605 [Candidatus Methanofishera endochildressiae]|uniref:Apolipoprotein N-acyltransferase N-terminal domain-containing protein n=1 Tax=Candidatus Methanofishera endochildressiae TaxID=2738884 RepID=A0A7Z0MMH2_9GAMM|nr:hypothetical protein [Candidatus Methanofishera endochildressiae]
MATTYPIGYLYWYQLHSFPAPVLPFGFIPLWIFWEQQTRLKNVILGGFVTIFVFTLIGFNWVTFLLHEFAHVPWLAGVWGVVISLF